MFKKSLFSLAAVLALSGCASWNNPYVRADLHATLDKGAQAIEGRQVAFDALRDLRGEWSGRGEQDLVYKLSLFDRGARDDAAGLVIDIERVLAARDAILSQQELTGVMLSALKDLEAEYDAMVDTLVESEAPVASVALAAGQKYLAQRMATSIVTMTKADMTDAVEAADTFGRDVARFQQMLDAAMNGNDDLGIEPPDNPDVEESLAQIEELFTGYIADSSEDVLENVVAQYDAWAAVQDMRVLADRRFGRPAAKAEPADDAVAPPEDAGAADEPAEDEAAPAEDEAAMDEPADDAAMDDAGEDAFTP